MRLDNTLYAVPKIKKGHKYESFFKLEPKLAKLVAFSGAMKLPRHRWFYYKQGFSPSLVRYFLDNYEIPVPRLVDPFSGVGTAPMTASYEYGYESIGYDISPLVIEIAKAKISNPDRKRIIKLLDIIDFELYSEDIDQYYLNKSFDENVLRSLLGIRKTIQKKFKADDKKFLFLCLLSIFHEFAHAKRDGGFLRFITKENIPNPHRRFKEVAINFLNDLDGQKTIEFDETIQNGKINFEVADARSLPAESNSTGIILTSPPYLNRYDYTRIYALELALLGLADDEVKSIRKQTLKSHIEAKHLEFPELNSELLRSLMDNLNISKLTNPKVPEMVLGYFHDLAWNIAECKRILAAKGVLAYVVGNCRFSGLHVEVDTIIAEIGESLGLTLDSIIVAKTRGSSAQQVRNYGDLPLRESIVVLRKE